MIETAPYFVATATGRAAIAVASPAGLAEVYAPWSVSWRGTDRTAWTAAAAARGAIMPPTLATVTGFAALPTYGVLRSTRPGGRPIAWRLDPGGVLTYTAADWTDDVPQTSNHATVAARCAALGITPPTP